MILFLDQSIKKVEAVHFTVLCTTLYSNSNSDDSLIWVIEILVFRFWKICGVSGLNVILTKIFIIFPPIFFHLFDEQIWRRKNWQKLEEKPC